MGANPSSSAPGITLAKASPGPAGTTPANGPSTIGPGPTGIGPGPSCGA